MIEYSAPPQQKTDPNHTPFMSIWGGRNRDAQFLYGWHPHCVLLWYWSLVASCSQVTMGPPIDLLLCHWMRIHKQETPLSLLLFLAGARPQTTISPESLPWKRHGQNLESGVGKVTVWAWRCPTHRHVKWRFCVNKKLFYRYPKSHRNIFVEYFIN